MTYRNIGFIFVLIAMLLCLVPSTEGQIGLMVLRLIFGILGVSVIVGTAVEARD